MYIPNKKEVTMATKKRVVVDIDEKRHHRLKVKVLSEGKTITEVLTAFIDKYIQGTK